MEERIFRNSLIDGVKSWGLHMEERTNITYKKTATG